MANLNALPKESDFPPRAEFYIFEWDVPLSKEPTGDGKAVCYYNWYGGKRRSYPIERLKLGNNWPAESFDHWLEVIRESL